MKISVLTAVVMVGLYITQPVSAQFIESPTPPPPTLKNLEVPEVVEQESGLPLVDESTDGAGGFIKDEGAAILLGKALFWDMQMGSDGVACATCHYSAGADARERNQLSPGFNDDNFDITAGGGVGGPNYDLTQADFPFHQLMDVEDRSSTVIFDSDDVASSAGTFSADFIDVVLGNAVDNCTVTNDQKGFRVGNVNTRRVEPRNTPTVINAVFNFRQFWDGRANNVYNGHDASGYRNADASVLEMQGSNAAQVMLRFENSSLASQAMVPPVSDVEISCVGRTFPKIGKKLLSLQPLGLQKVHSNDSVLAAVRDSSGTGLNIDYQTLIQNAFANRFWDSNKLFDAAQNEIGTGMPANTDQYSLTEINFGLFWGLAIQAYETTLISDDSKFDQWSEANEADGGELMPITDGQGILSDSELSGMNLFFTNTPGERGLCSTCHQGPTFTTAAFPFRVPESGEFPEVEQMVERMRMGDGITILEDLPRWSISGEGTVGGMHLSGRAGSLQLPSIYKPAVIGEFSVDGCSYGVDSFLMDQDQTMPADPNDPPAPVGPVVNADRTTRDAVFTLSGDCGPPLQITIIDAWPDGTDSAMVAEILVPQIKLSQEPPVPPVVGDPIAEGPVTGDFELQMPVAYDTGFYNIGVRPTEEDPGIGGVDDYGNPLSFTRQWVAALLGTPPPDEMLNFNLARTAEPFNWFADAVFFPDGLAGPTWLTHALTRNADFGFPFCRGPTFPPAPADPPVDNQADCEAGADITGNSWFDPPEFSLFPQFPFTGGRGDEAVPLYSESTGKTANYDAIMDMPTGVDGAFKTAGLRNAELTGPYFHNGGQRTLEEVVEFYNRGADFSLDNVGNLSPNIHPLDLSEQDRADLVVFLKTLTDERVRCEQAPFDHPEITLPDGHEGSTSSVTLDGNGNAADRDDIISEVGATGSNECIEPFLN